MTPQTQVISYALHGKTERRKKVEFLKAAFNYKSNLQFKNLHSCDMQ